MHALLAYLRLGSSGKNGSQLGLLVECKLVVSGAIQVDSKSGDTQNGSVFWLAFSRISQSHASIYTCQP